MREKRRILFRWFAGFEGKVEENRILGGNLRLTQNMCLGGDFLWDILTLKRNHFKYRPPVELIFVRQHRGTLNWPLGFP